MWRLVFGKVARLEEIERSWSLGDIVRANQIFTLQLENARPPEPEHKQ